MERIDQAVLAIKSTQPNSVEFKRAYENLGITLSEVLGRSYIHGTGSAHYGTYTEGKSDYDFTIFENCMVYEDVISKYEALGFKQSGDEYYQLPLYLLMRDSNNINLIITNSFKKYTLRNQVSDTVVGKNLPKDAVVTMFHTMLCEPMRVIYK